MFTLLLKQPPKIRKLEKAVTVSKILLGFTVENFEKLLEKRRPNHDRDHFEFISRGPIFHFVGYPRMTRQMPLLHSGTQRKHKDFSSDLPSTFV